MLITMIILRIPIHIVYSHGHGLVLYSLHDEKSKKKKIVLKPKTCSVLKFSWIFILKTECNVSQRNVRIFKVKVLLRYIISGSYINKMTSRIMQSFSYRNVKRENTTWQGE